MGSVPCWFDGGGRRGCEDDCLLILVFDLGVEVAKIGIFLGLVVDLSEKVVAANGEAVWGGFGLESVDGEFLEVYLVAGWKRLHGEDGWELDAYSILIDASIREVDRNVSFLLRESGFRVGFEDVCWDEQALTGGGADRSFDLKVDDEGLFEVFELFDGGNLDVGSGRQEPVDIGAKFSFQTFIIPVRACCRH